jgi:hypothetical protein
VNDAERCPRCGQANRCAQAGQTQAVADCWCFHTPIEQSLIDQLPAEQRDKSCLCPNCAHILSGESGAE